MADLQAMRDERDREMECICREVYLKKILNEVNREVDVPQRPPLQFALFTNEAVRTPALVDINGACEARERRVAGRDQYRQTGPRTISHAMSAVADIGQRETPPQSVPLRASLPPETAPRPLTSTASSTFKARVAPTARRLETTDGHRGDVIQIFPPMLRRNRQLHPLPSWARTLIVRNVPWRCNQDDLIHMWPPDGTYDYFHTPYHFFNDRPLGVAYLNFTTIEAAVAFQDRWHGRYLSALDTKRTLDITVANVQGRGPNLARIVKENIPTLAEKHFLPILLDGKRRMGTHETIAELNRFCTAKASKPRLGVFQ